MTTTFDIINAILNKDDDILLNLPSDTPYWLLLNTLRYSINTLNLELFNNLVEKGAKLDDNEIAYTLKFLVEKGDEEWLDTFVSQIPEDVQQLINMADIIVGAAIKYNKLDVLKKWYPKLSTSHKNYSLENEMRDINKKDIEIIKFLTSDKNLLENLNKCLISNITNKNLSNVEYCISKGADINEGFHKPLSYAINSGCPDIVQLLLSHGANVYKHIFLSALYKYMENFTDESRQIVKLLLDNVDETLLTNTNSGDDYWNKNLRL